MMNYRRRRRIAKQKAAPRPPADTNICGLCKQAPDKHLFGHFFKDERAGLSVHQYCMFFASGLAQNGEDEDGFDGFLVPDIQAEITRSVKLLCGKCKCTGASIGCCVGTCRRKYHYLCGKEHHALFQFFGSFKTYCYEHRPHQPVPVPSRFGPFEPISVMCPICLCNVTPDTGIHSLRTPCCKNTWFHRDCIQRQAVSSGMYFFRCPVCNNKDKFQNEMNVMGIYIPDQDAIWEQGDAYADLLFTYNQCDATRCLSRKGRTFSAKTGQWRIRLCDHCGQSGTHVKCQHWKKAPDEWTCEVCAGCSITDSNSEAGSSEAGSSSSDRSGPQQRVEDSDTDADVEVRDNSGGPQPCANYRKEKNGRMSAK